MKIHLFNRGLIFSSIKSRPNLSLLLPIFPVLFLGSGMRIAHATDYFNPYALDKRGSQSIADIDNLDVFSESGGQLPGNYLVDVIVNSESVGSHKIAFYADNNNLLPELIKQQLVDWGVNPNASAALSAMNNTAVITSLSDMIPGASVKFDFTQQKLIINIPQIAMNTAARGVVPSELWEQGISALTLDYGFSGSQTWHDDNKSQRSEFLSLRSGANVGAWRLRNYSVYTKSNDERHWENINTYAERNIIALKSQLTLGQTVTSGDIFDSFQFIGGRLASDDNMLPYSLRGFAPVVQGIAPTNAKVTVRQNGYVIYQTYVSAGPFEITDLYPTSSSGNLEVTVEGMEGSEQTFVVPFSSVPVMQRKGQYKYSVSGGKYRANSSLSREPNFIQSSLIYGLPWNTTLYGGFLYSRDYSASAVGTGLNLGSIGALSFDVTDAHTNFDVYPGSARYHGQSYRFQYAKSLLSSGTTVTLAGYRYSTEGYYDFSEANDYYQSKMHFNKRSRLQANISQVLGDYGSVYVNAYQQNFWGRQGYEKTVSAGYNSSWRAINYGVNYSYNNLPGRMSANQLFSFNISFPFDALSLNSYINGNMSTDNHGRNNFQLGVSGNGLNNRLNYSVQQSLDNRNQQNSGNASLSYKGRSGIISSGYSYSSGTQRLNYGVQGGLVLHSDGVTLSQPLGETIAIVRAVGAEGVEVQNRTGVTTNSQGYAVVSYLSPYQRNRIQLGIETLEDNVDLVNNSTTVIPTQGAVVWADFKTHIGWRALIKLTVNGDAVPFGAIVSLYSRDKSVNITGIVGDSGAVYLNGLPEHGELQVQWGESDDQRCHAAFTLPVNKTTPVLQLASNCLISSRVD